MASDWFENRFGRGSRERRRERGGGGKRRTLAGWHPPPHHSQRGGGVRWVWHARGDAVSEGPGRS